MSKYKGRYFLSVIWKDSETGSRIEVGRLSWNGCYEFIYIESNLDKVQKKGFKALVAFPDFSKCYKNEEMFPAFSSRLPDKRRKDIDIILKKYNLKKYDAFEILRESGGMLPTDSLEFIDPIFYNTNEDILREFFIAGTRHCDLCQNNTFPNCIMNFELEKDENLIVVSETENEYDKNAVLLLKNSDRREKIGYIPAYYAEAVSNAIANKQTITCIVKKILKDNCQECVKVILKIEKISNL